MVLLPPGPYSGEPLFPAVGGLAAQFWWAGRKKALNIAKFLGLMGVGEGLAPPESPRAMPGNQRAGQATAPTTAQQDGAAKTPERPHRAGRPETWRVDGHTPGREQNKAESLRQSVIED